ncbi:WG repeat-containing protein [Chitinophaga silvatica]|uniref:WG repeat-containing protein n=1 Tax=Chitinophaga silvatica TaxID=2282649 RepID=A0A3E1YG91_9BACT|nr:WG repeat-containing protein [Chitinophaga silvatica]RFS26425.1 WG repeat-containing protein [Chitinophaga silvatica]
MYTKNYSVLLFAILSCCFIHQVSFAQIDVGIIESKSIDNSKRPARELVPFLKGRLWGYCDINKNIVIEPKFDKAEFFMEYKDTYYAKVILNNGKTTITADGNTVGIKVPDTEIFVDEEPLMDQIRRNVTIDATIPGFQYDKEKRQLKLSATYRSIESLIDDGKFGVVRDKHTGLIGAINPAGKILVSFNYDKFIGVAGANNELLILQNNWKVGVVDLNNNIIVPFDYATIEVVNKPGTSLLLTKPAEIFETHSYLVDTSNKKLFDGELLFAEYGDGLIMAVSKGYFGYIDGSGKEVIPFKYVNARPFGELPAVRGFAKVTNTNSQTFFINNKGVEFISEK